MDPHKTTCYHCSGAGGAAAAGGSAAGGVVAQRQTAGRGRGHRPAHRAAREGGRGRGHGGSAALLGPLQCAALRRPRAQLAAQRLR